MQFSIHLDSKTITRSPDTIAPDNSTRSFIRGDGEPIGLVFTKGTEFTLAAGALPGTPEIKFIAKRTTDYGGRPLVVNGDGFVYDSATTEYTAYPSFGDGQMAAVFVGAVDVAEVTGNTTLDISHKSKLIVCTGASDVIITVPNSIFAATDKVYVMRGGTGAVTIVAGSGITLTDPDAYGAGLDAREIASLTFTSASAATVAEAAESSSVSLGFEITWRDVDAVSPSWSSVQFTATVRNERFQGNEDDPVALGDPSNYYTKAEANAAFLEGPIVTADLSANVVTTAKILDANVTTAKLADDAVTTIKITDANVTTAKIADSNVTTAKIADSAITTAKVNDSAITTAKVADSAITAAKLAAGTRALPVNASNITASTYTFVLGDADTLRLYSSSSEGAFTIPLNATVAYPIGTQLIVMQLSSGPVSLAIAAGGTLLAYDGITSTKQYGRLSVVKLATDTWAIEPSAYDRAYETTDSGLVIGSTVAEGGVQVIAFTGLPGVLYNFSLSGYYISSINTEGLSLYMEAGASVAIEAGAHIVTASTGAVTTGNRSTAAANIGTAVAATASGGVVSGVSVSLPFGMSGKFSIPDATVSSTRLFKIKAATKVGSTTPTITLGPYTFRAWPARP